MKKGKPVRVLHFADAHIDQAWGGRFGQSGLPLRVEDFIAALGTITQAAIDEKVDLVIFAGDAYKDRTPAPVITQAWNARMKALSEAGIPTIILVGNHDTSPGARMHAYEALVTLRPKGVIVVDRPCLLTPQQLGGAPVQVLAIPWVNKSAVAAVAMNAGLDSDSGSSWSEVEALTGRLIEAFKKQADPALPLIVAAHASMQGAVYGGERAVMLGSDFTLSRAALDGADYVALGHIHKAQDLNGPGPCGDRPQEQPPIVYPGSIERVDFGEVDDEKYYVVADVKKGDTVVNWRPLNGRKFLDVAVQGGESAAALSQLPLDVMDGAVVRVSIDQPEGAASCAGDIRLACEKAGAVDVRINVKTAFQARTRISQDVAVEAMSPAQALEVYYQSLGGTQDEQHAYAKNFITAGDGD